jgi:hypothetical protein
MKNLALACVALLAAIVMGVVPSFVQAGTLGPITTSTPIPSTLTDWNGSLAFPQFNPALGTLDSVTLELSSTMATVVTVTNNEDPSSGSSSNGGAKTELQVSVQDAGLNLTQPDLDFYSPNFAYTLLAGSSTSSGLLTKTANDGGNTYTLPAVLGEFTGLGSLSLSASTFTQTSLTNNGGNTSASQVTDAALTGTVEYTYTAVPEPSSIALLVAGLVGGRTFWKRRRRAA